jgi:prolipoprotein diacylglyceryltransferase
MLFEGACLFVVNGGVLLCMVKKKYFKIWLISSVFLMGYSVFRFLFEYLRNDAQSEFMGLFTKSQRVFLAVFVLGVALFTWSRKEKSVWL